MAVCRYFYCHFTNTRCSISVCGFNGLISLGLSAPKYFFCQFKNSFGCTSPTTTKVALFGAYQALIQLADLQRCNLRYPRPTDNRMLIRAVGISMVINCSCIFACGLSFSRILRSSVTTCSSFFNSSVAGADCAFYRFQFKTDCESWSLHGLKIGRIILPVRHFHHHHFSNNAGNSPAGCLSVPLNIIVFKHVRDPGNAPGSNWTYFVPDLRH